jgi:hypothetical protein
MDKQRALSVFFLPKFSAERKKCLRGPSFTAWRKKA